MAKKELPELDEFVIATIKKIFPYGAFCTLDEYENREAYIHISEVAPRWIKNIHEFLKEGRKIVAKVFRIVLEKNQIDLSLKRVNESDRRRKLDSYKKEKRATKLFELAAKKLGKPYQEACDVESKLVSEFGNLYSMFEEVAGDAGRLDKLDIGGEWKKFLYELALQNIHKPIVKISGILTLNCMSSDGVEVIKEALIKARSIEEKETEINITYLGAPRYMISVVAQDYKKAERIMGDAVISVEKFMLDKGGKARIERERAAGV
jgi:translation initiation factor 2 subunit 1